MMEGLASDGGEEKVVMIDRTSLKLEYITAKGHTAEQIDDIIANP